MYTVLKMSIFLLCKLTDALKNGVPEKKKHLQGKSISKIS